jgi:hypothetical protein
MNAPVVAASIAYWRRRMLFSRTRRIILIAAKHGGVSTLENLALACFDCNRFKGSDIASRDAVSGELVPLFNPRTQRWNEHFRLEGGQILPLTSVGRVTTLLLKFNLPQRIEVRTTLARTGRYPGGIATSLD